MSYFKYSEPPIEEEFVFTTTVRVNKLTVRWDIFWGQYPANVLMKANNALNTAAKQSINQQNPYIFINAQNKYREFGAADSEPSRQFDRLWEEAFGLRSEW